MAIYRRDENKDKEEVEGELEEPPPLLTDVIKALTTLQRFKMLREDSSRSIQALNQLLGEFMVLIANKKT